MKCSGCGCTDTQACEGGCHWVLPRLCSKCVETSKKPLTKAQIRPLVDMIIAEVDYLVNFQARLPLDVQKAAVGLQVEVYRLRHMVNPVKRGKR